MHFLFGKAIGYFLRSCSIQTRESTHLSLATMLVWYIVTFKTEHSTWNIVRHFYVGQIAFDTSVLSFDPAVLLRARINHFCYTCLCCIIIWYLHKISLWSSRHHDDVIRNPMIELYYYMYSQRWGSIVD